MCPPSKMPATSRRLADRRSDFVSGRRLHLRDLSAAAAVRVERLLDRRGVDAAHGRRCGDRARSGERRRDRSRRGRAASRTTSAATARSSLMLMATAGLFRAGLVEWVTAMTYQAASGAGAPQMRELVAQMGYLHARPRTCWPIPQSSILDIDRRVADGLRSARPADGASSGIRSPAACCRGSPTISAPARARKSGRRRPKPTRFSASPRARFRSRGSASASARCGATARR